MSFKVTVDYKNLRVIIDTDSLQPVSTFQQLKSLVTFTDLKSFTQYVQMEAANVFVDSDTKNLFFMASLDSPNAESFGFTDSEVRLVSLVKTDSIPFEDFPAKDFGVGKSDSVSMTQELSRVVFYFRDLTDSYGIVDAPAKKPVSVPAPVVFPFEKVAICPG